VGARFAVRVRYHGTPQRVAFPGSRSDVAGIGAKVGDGGGLAALSEPYGAYSWFPCSDQPSDKAMLDVDVTVPAGWAGVSSGRFADTVAGAGGTRTYRWRAAEPIATYLVAFAVDRFDGLNATGPRGLPVTYWVRPADRDRMWPLLRRTPELLEWLEARLGPYPFGSAGVVVVPDASGLETQTMVTLGPLRGPEALPVLLHELSHQWFGDAVTPADLAGPVAERGLRHVRPNAVRGGPTGRQPRRDAGPVAGRGRGLAGEGRTAGTVRPRPVRRPQRLLRAGADARRDRERIGDARFDGLLRDWPQQHRHTNQDRASFVAWLNAYAGQDLTPVVNHWLD
jgi:aminopeptidase N